MSLSKYFRTDQKLLLRPLESDNQAQRIETLSAYLRSCDKEVCDLVLPYRTPPGEEFPFESEMRLEVLGDSLGMGVRAFGCFDRQLDRETIRIRMEPDLQMFQRRLHRRSDGQAGIRFTRGEGTLRSFRSQWQKNIRLLELPVNQVKLKGLPLSPVNLSAGGIRLLVKPPVLPADLFLLYLEIEAGKPTLCILAEAVWTGSELPDGRVPAGMQFVNILKQDQTRIEQHIRQLTSAADAPPAP